MNVYRLEINDISGIKYNTRTSMYNLLIQHKTLNTFKNNFEFYSFYSFLRLYEDAYFRYLIFFSYFLINSYNENNYDVSIMLRPNMCLLTENSCFLL